MRHDRRSAMITDEFVVEKPSFVEIKLTGDNIILYDYLLEQRFVLSPIAYEMFLEFDGIKSIRDIAIIIAQEYGEVLENIIHDVTDLVVSLARVNIILVKGKDKRLKSTKTDAGNHGVGLSSVYRIAAKYHGVVTIDDDVANRFLIRVVLYGKQE